VSLTLTVHVDASLTPTGLVHVTTVEVIRILSEMLKGREVLPLWMGSVGT